MDIDDIVPGSDTPVEVAMSRDPSDNTWETQTEGWWLAPITPREGWPHTEFTVRSQFSWEGRYARITAEFGWPEVPEPVKRACLMQAGRILTREKSLLGLQTNADYGDQAVYARFDPLIAQMLQNYRKHRLTSRW